MSERVIKISWTENEVTINDVVFSFFGGLGVCKAVVKLCASNLLAFFFSFVRQGQGKCFHLSRYKVFYGPHVPHIMNKTFLILPGFPISLSLSSVAISDRAHICADSFNPIDKFLHVEKPILYFSFVCSSILQNDYSFATAREHEQKSKDKRKNVSAVLLGFRRLTNHS